MLSTSHTVILPSFSNLSHWHRLGAGGYAILQMYPISEMTAVYITDSLMLNSQSECVLSLTDAYILNRQ